jgi:hypothetical protein
MPSAPQNLHSSLKHSLRISELRAESGKLNAFQGHAPNDRGHMSIEHNPRLVPSAG